MSSLFRKLFSLTRSRNESKSSQGAGDQLSNDTQDPQFPKSFEPQNHEFGSDDRGQSLQQSWQAYYDASYKKNEESDLQQSKYIDFAKEFYVAYSQYIKIQNFSNHITSSSGMECLGHPVDVIIEFALTLLKFLKVEEKSIGSEGYSSSYSRLLSSSHIPVVSLYLEYDEVSIDMLLSTMKCLSIISYWTNNTKVIHFKLGDNFSSVILGLLWSSISEIKQILDSEMTISSNHVERITFYAKIAHYCIIMISCPSCPEFENVDYSLPSHPWVDDHLDQIDWLNTAGACYPEFKNSISPSLPLSNRHKPYPTSDMKVSLSNWQQELVDLNCVELFMVLISMISSMLSSVDKLAFVDQTSIDQRLWKCFIALQCELLDTVSRYSILSPNSSICDYHCVDGEKIIGDIKSTYPIHMDNHDRILSLLLTRRYLQRLQIYKLHAVHLQSILFNLFQSNEFTTFLQQSKQNLDMYLIEPELTRNLENTVSSHHIVLRSPSTFLVSHNMIDLWPWSCDNPSLCPPLWQQCFLEYRLDCNYISNSRSGEVDLWYRSSMTGRMWQAILDMLFACITLNHTQTDHSMVDMHATDKPVAKNVSSSTFETCLSGICTSIKVATNASLSAVTEDRIVLPWFQLQLILFLTRCFRHEPDITSQVMKDTDMVRFLFSAQFLCYETITAGSPNFAFNTSIDEGLNTSTLVVQPTSITGIQIVTQISVNDATFTFLQEFFSYPANVVSKSWKPTDEIMSVIPTVFYNLSQQVIPIDYIIFQLARFMHKILIGYSHQLQFNDLPEQVLAAFIEIYCNFPATSSDQQTQRPFLWHAKSSVISLILWFSTNTYGSGWINILSQHLCFTPIDDINDKLSFSFQQDESFRLRGQSYDSVSDELSRHSITSRSSALSYDLLSFLLLDPSLRMSAISMYINLITTICSVDGSKLRSDPNRSSPSIKSSEYDSQVDYLRIVTCKILDLGSSAKNYPAEHDIYRTYLLILRSLTWILRHDDYLNIRSRIQEVLRNLDIIPNMITSVSHICSYKRDEHYSVHQDIMRQCISFITSLMWNNQSIRQDIEGILAPSAVWKEDINASGQVSKPSLKRLTSDNSLSSASTSKKSNYGLRHMILQVETPIHLESMILLFEMMLETPCMTSNEAYRQVYPTIESRGMFYSDDDKPKIINAFIIPFIFHIFKFCDDKVQSFIIFTFSNLITGRASLLNISICCQIIPGLADLILDLFPITSESVALTAVNLLATLGQYNISVAQMKHLFHLFQPISMLAPSSEKIKVRPSYSWMLIQALKRMFKEYDGPRHTFILDGHHSGIQLPPISRWPSKKGLTISIWFRVEVPKYTARRSSMLTTDVSSDVSSQHTLNTKEYQPYLICMRNPVTGAGIEIYLRAINISLGTFRIVLNYHREDRTVLTFSKELKNMIVCDGQWHYLAVSLQMPGGYSNKTEASMLLDELYVKDRFLVPEMPSDIQDPVIGTCPKCFQSDRIRTTFRGQIGAVYFFGDALSEGHMRSIKALGPTYFYAFEPYTPTYRDVSASLLLQHAVDPSSVLDGSLTSLIILSYNPAVCVEDLILDNTPSQNMVKWRLPYKSPETSTSTSAGIRMDAKKLEGTNFAMQQDVRTAFDALGGVAAVLPIFATLDLPQDVNGNNVDTKIFPSVLELLITVLGSTIENKTMLRQLAGFDVISSFFADLASYHFTDEVFELLLNLFIRLDWDETYQDGILEKVFCNFRLWRETSISMQTKVLDWLIGYYQKFPAKLRYIATLEKMINALYLVYEYDHDYTVIRSQHVLPSSTVSPTTSISDCNIEPHHPIVNDHEMLSTIRSKFFSFIRLTMTKHSSVILPEDIRQLISYAHLTNSYRSKIEVIDFLYDLLSDQANPSLPPYTLLGFAYDNCFHSLMLLFHHKHSQVRLRALLLVFKLVSLAVVFKLLPAVPASSTYTQLNYVSSHPENDNVTFSSTLFTLGLDGPQLVAVFMQINDWLIAKIGDEPENMVDYQCSFVLLACQQMMLGMSCDDLLKNMSSENLDEPTAQFDHQVASAKICIPHLYSCIIHLISADIVSSAIRYRVLANLRTIIISTDNCDQVLQLISLQQVMLRLVGHHRDEETQSLCISILSQLIITSMMIGKPLHRPEISRIEEAKHRQLTVYQACMRMQSRERIIGAVVLLESMELLHSSVLIPEVKCNIINQLFMQATNNLEENLSNQGSLVSSERDSVTIDNQVLIFYKRSQEMNLWIVADRFDAFLNQYTITSDISIDIISTSKHLLEVIDSVNPTDGESMQPIPLPNGERLYVDLNIMKARIPCSLIRLGISEPARGFESSIDQLESSLSSRRTQSSQASYESIRLYAIASLYTALNTSLNLGESINKTKAVKLLIKLVIMSYDIIVNLLLAVDQHANLSEVDFTSILSEIINNKQSVQKSLMLSSEDSRIYLSVQSNPTSVLTVDDVYTLYQQEATHIPPSHQVIFAITKALNISTSSMTQKESLVFIEVIIQKAISVILSFCHQLHINIRSKSYTSLGITSTIYQPMDLDQIRSSSSNWKITCSTAYDKLISSILCDLEENARIQTALSRSITRIKTGVLHELQNERGPWGDLHQNITTYWCLDPALSNQLTSPKITRNLLGTRHSVASQRSLTGLGGGGSSSMNINEPNQVLRAVFKFRPNPLAKGVADMDEDDYEESFINANNSSSDIVIPVTASSTVLFTSEVEIITPATNSTGARSPGTLVLTKYQLSYLRKQENEDFDFVNRTGNKEFQWACKNYPSTSWKLSEILAVVQRRYQLREVGLEIIFTSRSSLFINAMEIKQAKKLYKLLTLKNRCINMIPGGFLPLLLKSQSSVAINLANPNGNSIANHNSTLDGYSHDSSSVSNSNLAKALSISWANREISNFDYLMQLNTLAGRSYNDLGQYPVFPWVIADYTSSKLDFKDPRTFRDFRYPIGAQSETQRNLLHEKYETIAGLSQDDCPPYHYGSHYSTAGFVIWYLMRLEPYTSYHVWLQDGKFDRPDRLFHSIESTYRGCTTNLMDVKELTPEWFYLPEFLDNTNNIEFGTTQAGHKIGSVVLPPWAKNSHDFIRIHREALECDYVSLNIHLWIDLIFGYKQRPPHLTGGDTAAIDACNCYMHFTYADAIDLEDLNKNDTSLYQTAVRQIENFGQTPMQLFDRPHPQRQPYEVVNIIWPIASVIEGVQHVLSTQDNTKVRSQSIDMTRMASTAVAFPVIEKPNRMMTHDECKVSYQPILFMGELLAHEKLVTIDASRLLGYHNFRLLTPDLVPPYNIKLDAVTLKASECYQSSITTSRLHAFKSSVKERRIGVPFAAVISSSTAHHSVVRTYQPFIGKAFNKANLIQSETERIVRRERARDQSVRGPTPSTTSTSPMATPIKSVKLQRSETATTMLTSSSSNHDFGISAMSLDPESSTSSRMKLSKPQQGSSRNLTASVSTPTTTITSSSSPARANKQQQTPRLYDHLTCQLFAYLPEPKIIFSCGHWDHTFRASFMDTGKLIQSISHHRDVVTCLAVASDFHTHWLVTGSRDCTVMIWEISINDKDLLLLSASAGSGGTGNIITMPPLHVLYGHDDVITCLAVDAEFDLVCSGSEDGTIIMSTLRTGTYLRSIILGAHPNDNQLSSRSKRGVHILTLTKDSYIIAYSQEGDILCTYTINGRLLRMIDAGEHLHCIIASEDGKVILTGGDRCLVVMRWASTLALANTGARSELEAVIDGTSDRGHLLSSPIRSLRLVTSERLLLIGLESGEVCVVGQDSEYLRRRLHRKLMEIGILPRNDASGLIL